MAPRQSGVSPASSVLSLADNQSWVDAMVDGAEGSEYEWVSRTRSPPTEDPVEDDLGLASLFQEAEDPDEPYLKAPRKRLDRRPPRAGRSNGVRRQLPVKLGGTLFGDLRPIPTEAGLDPPPGRCFNCWQRGHGRSDCPRPQRSNYCFNCGRRHVRMRTCPRCRDAHVEWQARRDALATLHARSAPAGRSGRPAAAKSTAVVPLCVTVANDRRTKRPREDTPLIRTPSESTLYSAPAQPSSKRQKLADAAAVARAMGDLSADTRELVLRGIFAEE